MAKKKAKPRHPFYADPLGKLPDFSWGVLRTNFNNKPNSVSFFAYEKSRLSARSEMLLPTDAPDQYLIANSHWLDYEKSLLPDQRDLATCLTLYFPGARTLHGVWEEVRAFARAQLVEARQLPVQLVLHAPGLGGSAHDVHAHVIICARRLHPWGWGTFSDLLTDKAQSIVWEAWTEHRAAVAGGAK